MRFYHFIAIIVTWYSLEELTEKKICMHCALSISPKKIVNSAYISSSSVLFNFLSGHRFLNKAFAKTRQNQRVVNFSLFFSFSQDYVRYSEYNCLSFTNWLLRVFFVMIRCHFDFQIYVWTTYTEYVSL